MKQCWEIKKLWELCELSAGGDVPKSDFSEIKTAKHQVPIFANGEKNLGLYGYTSFPKVTKPSITVSARGTIGFSVKRLENFYPIVRLIVVTPKNLAEVDLSYLEYSFKNIEFKHSGTSIPQLTVPMIRDYKIPVPPFPEQQRIVSILDKAFAAIEKAKANAEQNLKNAKELFVSYLQSVLENRNWEEKKLGDVCQVIAGQSPEGKFYNKDGNGLPFYQGKKEYGAKYIGDPTTWTTKVTKEAVAGDILISVRAPVGPINFSTQRICIGRGLAVIRAGKPIDKEFLYFILLNHEKNIVGNIGAVFNSINKSQIESINIHLPQLTEQQTILRQLDALQAETQKLESIYQKKIKNLAELKKSILQKAFSGELNTTKDIAV